MSINTTDQNQKTPLKLWKSVPHGSGRPEVWMFFGEAFSFPSGGTFRDIQRTHTHGKVIVLLTAKNYILLAVLISLLFKRPLGQMISMCNSRDEIKNCNGGGWQSDMNRNKKNEEEQKKPQSENISVLISAAAVRIPILNQPTHGTKSI